MQQIKTRALKEDFLNEFLFGKLNNILKVIQRDNNLIMCLRGNYTTVYYRGLQILKIRPDSFDVDKGYGINKPELKYDEEYWLEYFKSAKQKIDEHCCNGQAKLEKEIQQIMFRENSCNSIADETDYFIFDLEYAHKKARFDALAIFWSRKDRAFGKDVKLAIIEIKAGLKAINGNASLSKHYNDVKEFIENINMQEFLSDVKNIFSQMTKLGLINTKANPDKISINNNEIQFIFALANYNDNSALLQKEVELMKINHSSLLKTYIAKSSFLGYGLYEKGMIDVGKMISKPNNAKLIIHRGTKEIGGSAVEISNGDTKLLFDFGVPLDSMVKDEWQPEEYKLSHPDHYGLMQLINPDIPIYVSKVTYDVLTQIAPLLPKQNTTSLNLHVIDGDIDFGNIKVKAHRVDHSIAGATAYEIEMNGKTIVYSGDIRFHGRASWQSSVFKRKIKNPDYLIMEGTTLGRAEQDIVKETDLEEEFVKIFKSGKLPLVQFSPQNIDRFVTVYRACKRTGKTLVIDPYTAFVLEVYASMSDSIPQFHWENIMVNFAHSSINHKLAEEKILFRYKDKKITLEEIVANPEKFVVKGNWSINKQIFDAIDHDKLEIVFSMWKGYLDRPNQFDNYTDVKLTPLHTSGHAYIEDLHKLVEKMQPKHLIPIHTECKDKYQELFNANIVTLNDGEELDL